MKKLIEALLNDDHGISEQAYNALLNILEDMGRTTLMEEKNDAFDAMRKYAKEAFELKRRVQEADATDGRFYFSEVTR